MLLKESHSVYRSMGNGKNVILNLLTNEVFLLNDVSSDIWKLIDGIKTDSEIINIITENYNADKQLVTDDYFKFKNDILNKKLVVEKTHE